MRSYAAKKSPKPDRGKIKLIFLALMAVSASMIFYGAKKVPAVKVVESPPLNRINSYYVGNRPPLQPNPLVKLPPGQVEPRGWILSQLQLMRDGLTGQLQEISRFLKEDSGWVTSKGRGWEEMPYWLKGYGNLAYLLKDPEMIASARRWIEAILNSQQPDGYFGPVDNKENNDLWPNMVALACLQSYYEASKDNRVLEFMSRYFRYQLNFPEEKLFPGSWQKLRAGENLESVYWLYNRTGENWLLDLGPKIFRRMADWTASILTSERDKNWQESSFYHGVNIAMGFKYPGVYYQQTKERKLLDAVEENYSQVMEAYGQQPGGMFGADENIRPGFNDPRQGAETCTMVEFMNSFESLLKISGQIVYADRSEEIALNSLPAAMTPDLKALHYLTAANLISGDSSGEHDFQNSGTLLSFDPWKYRCCQHNVAFGWPYYAEHLWLATSDNGLAALFYGPSMVMAKVGQSGKTVRVVQDTDYPFSTNILMTVFTDEPVAFALYLRTPGWAEKAKVGVNAEEPAEIRAPGRFLVIEGTWRNGDQIRLTFDQPVRVKFWPGVNQAASIRRGPLWYSLEIKEEWKRCGGTDDWPTWEVLPASSWNYGLVIDPENPEKDIKLKETRSVNYQPFSLESAPVVLESRARQMPDWKAEGRMVGKVPSSPVVSNLSEEKIRLIPMGCARLRITVFPWIKSR
jgi:hypothetical protein